jgi:hypothetical protein
MSDQPVPLPQLLTEDERKALEMTTELSRLLKRIVYNGSIYFIQDLPTPLPDWVELCAAVHIIQRAIGAQAAARAYPDLYRLLGQ